MIFSVHIPFDPGESSKIPPAPLVPPSGAIPYRFPFASKTRFEVGSHTSPVKKVKEYRTVLVQVPPPGLNENRASIVRTPTLRYSIKVPLCVENEAALRARSVGAPSEVVNDFLG